MSIYDFNLYRDIPAAPVPQVMPGTPAPAPQVAQQVVPQIQANQGPDNAEERMTLRQCCRICFEEMSRAWTRLQSDAAGVANIAHRTGMPYLNPARGAVQTIAEMYSDQL